MKRLRLILAGFMLITTLATPIVSVGAYSIVDGIDCGKYSDDPQAKTMRKPAACKAAEKQTENPITGSNGLLVKIANIVSYVAGAAAIILIVVGAIRFMTSGGDAGRVKKARDSVIYALVGVAVIVLSRTLIYFVVNIYNQ